MIRARDLASTWMLTFVVAALLVIRNKALASGVDTRSFVQVVNATLIGQALSSFGTLGLPAVAGRTSVMSDSGAAHGAVALMERRIVTAHIAMMALVVGSVAFGHRLPGVVRLEPVEAAVLCAAMLAGGLEAIAAMHRSLRLRLGDSRSAVYGRVLGVAACLLIGLPLMFVTPVAGYAVTHILLTLPMLWCVRRRATEGPAARWQFNSADRRLAAASIALLIMMMVPMIVLREVLIGAASPELAAGFLAVVSVAATIRSAFLSAFGTVPLLAYDWAVPRFRALMLGAATSTFVSYVLFAAMSDIILPVLFSDDFEFTHLTVVFLAAAAAFEVYSWCTEAPFVRLSRTSLWMGGSLLNGLIVAAGLLLTAGSLTAQRAALVVFAGWLAQTCFDAIGSKLCISSRDQWRALLAGLAWICAVAPVAATVGSPLMLFGSVVVIAAVVVALSNLRRIGAYAAPPGL